MAPARRRLVGPSWPSWRPSRATTRASPREILKRGQFRVGAGVVRSAKNRRVRAGTGKKPEPRVRTRAPGAPAKRVKNARKLDEIQAALPIMDPNERRVRNRTLLILGLLGLVNSYVFFWRTDLLAALSVRPAAIMGNTEPGYADPVIEACGGDPVRIFAGLDDQIIQETRLSQGRTLRLGLLALGVPSTRIDAIEGAVRSHIDLGLLAGRGSPLRIAMDRYGGISAFEIELDEGRLIQGCAEHEEFRVRHLEHPLRTEVNSLALEIGADADLAAAVDAAGESPALAMLIAEHLANQVDAATELHPGDKIGIVVEKRYLGRNFHRYGKVLALRYRGSGQSFAMFLYKPTGKAAAWYDSSGNYVAREMLRSPVAWIPSRHGGQLAAPTVEYVEGRPGAIYRRPEGTPVVAPVNGTIESFGEQGDAGLVIVLRSSNGNVVVLSHLMRTLTTLTVGQSVTQGQVLALVGHSGKSAANRLRMEIQDVDGKYVDPLIGRTRQAAGPSDIAEGLQGDALKSFEREIEPWRKALRAAGH